MKSTTCRPSGENLSAIRELAQSVGDRAAGARDCKSRRRASRAQDECRRCRDDAGAVPMRFTRRWTTEEEERIYPEEESEARILRKKRRRESTTFIGDAVPASSDATERGFAPRFDRRGARNLFRLTRNYYARGGFVIFHRRARAHVRDLLRGINKSYFERDCMRRHAHDLSRPKVSTGGKVLMSNAEGASRICINHSLHTPSGSPPTCASR